MLIAAVLLFVTFLFSTAGTSHAQAKQQNSEADWQAINASSSPNVITVSFFAVANETEKNIIAAGNNTGNSLQSINESFRRSGDFAARSAESAASNVTSVTSAAGRKAGKVLGSIPPAIGSGFKTSVNGVGNGIGNTAGAIGNGVEYAATIPGNAIESVSDSAIVANVIRPADHAPVPIIDPNSPELHKARIAMNTPNPGATQQVDTAAEWPIRGKITTHFGVNHRPYQATHTGIDISDGNPSGVTAVKPFKPGRVIESVKSYTGLGNHVIIDHGSGVTSVYAHLSSISVKPGEAVDKNATLGFQGSTGLSTGPHLHFEIRVNGKAADPRNFISAQP